MKIKTLLAATALVLPTLAAADLGVSVNIGEPGFYGRIDIGDYPAPRLVYAQPVLVERVRERPAPIYLHVPPGHAKHWSQHCGEYGACGRPVYFVQDDWYQRVYVPEYRGRHGGGPDEDHGRGHGRGHDHH